MVSVIALSKVQGAASPTPDSRIHVYDTEADKYMSHNFGALVVCASLLCMD